jgi:hypothetical protein
MYRLVHGRCTCLWYMLIRVCFVRVVTGCLVQFDWYNFTQVYLIVIVLQWFHHSTSTIGWLDRAKTSGCSHLPIVAREHMGL